MVSKWERWATLSGALAVPFWVASVALISTKVKGSKGPEILTHYQQHSDGKARDRRHGEIAYMSQTIGDAGMELAIEQAVIV